MWQVGVWEREGSLSAALAALDGGGRCMLRPSCAPHPHWGVALDLLVVAPHGQPRPLLLPPCTAALVPGELPPPRFERPPQVWVSYGCASQNTLTLSSLTQTRASVAVQRAFPRLGGGVVERQELVLPCAGGDPLLVLAQAGAGLLLGLV